MTLLDGRTAVVTGAAQGIGLAIARTLHEHGASVMLLDRDGDAAAKAAAELAAASAACDETSEEDVHRAIDTAVERFGGLDILVNNAGITRDASMRKMSLADFEAVIDVHLKGSWLCTRAAAEVMRAAKSGAIVNMLSMSGKTGNPGQTNYSAAKAGIIGLTKASAKELARHGVRVNAVQPGLIGTPMTAAMPPDVFAQFEADVPLGRAGEPHEVANAVLFLASGLSSYITGAVLEVGGGRRM